jgi:hypothetical protein
MQELVGHTLLKRYRVATFIGRGGMAEVYKAWDNLRATFVAIKLLNEDLAEDFVFLHRFAREAQALERLEHPHIVRFLGFEEAPGMAFMVMEYIEGLTLRRYLNLLGRPLTLPEAMGVMQPVCSALHYAHQMGVYHCDVKPANIYVERGGRVVLGDFGIARLSESATVTFSTPGTPAYMSPEQCRGGEEIDGRTDIYSLGITTYEMLTLDRPFKGETDTTTGSRGERVRWEQMHLSPPPPRSINPEIPATVETVILRALEKDPPRRQQRVLELLAELRQAAAVEPAKVLPEVVEKRAEPIEPTPTSQDQASASTGARVGAPRTGIGVAVVGGGLTLLAVLIVALVGLSGLLGPSTPEPPTAAPLPPPTQVGPTEAAPAQEMTPVEPAVVPPTAAPIPSNVYVLYVLDESNSMMQSMGSQSKLAVAQAGLSRHLKSLDPTINAGLLAFGHRIHTLEDSSCTSGNVQVLAGMQAGSANDINELVLTISAIGNSPLEQVIRTSYQQFRFYPDRINALILVADGGDNCQGNPLDPIARNQEVGQHLPIYVAGLDVEAPDREQLERIAEETGGTYHDVSGVDDLIRVLDEFVDTLRQQ